MKQAKDEFDEQGEEQDLEGCINCGRGIPKNTRFCRECGAAQKKDSFPLLIVGCMVTILAVFFAWRLAAPYPLIISIAVPILVLVIFALILSFVLWR